MVEVLVDESLFRYIIELIYLEIRLSTLGRDLCEVTLKEVLLETDYNKQSVKGLAACRRNDYGSNDSEPSIFNKFEKKECRYKSLI